MRTSNPHKRHPALRYGRERARPSRALAGTDPETWTYEELFARARALHLPGCGRMTRRELIDELRPTRPADRDSRDARQSRREAVA